MNTNSAYLNKTPNRTARKGQKIEFGVIHETASPNPDNPYATLTYNLNPSVQSSYHYLIARDGTVFLYLSPDQFIAWHAGTSSALGYTDFSVNEHSIGIEFDGRNNGEPCTPAQYVAGRELIIALCTKYAIPRDRAHWLTHQEIAPSRKTDPKGINMDLLLLSDIGQEQVIGVKPSLTKEQWVAHCGLDYNDGIFIYDLAVQFEIDPAFLGALWNCEYRFSGNNNPLSIIAPEKDWEPHKSGLKLYESMKIGWATTILLMKNYCGQNGWLTIATVCAHFIGKSETYTAKVVTERNRILATW